MEKAICKSPISWCIRDAIGIASVVFPVKGRILRKDLFLCKECKEALDIFDGVIREWIEI